MDYDAIAQRYGKSVEEIAERVERARRSMVPKTKRLEVVESGKVLEFKVTREGVGPLKTPQGTFNHFNFHIDDKWEKYSVLIMADLTPNFYPYFKDKQNLMLRTDSGCETGQLFRDKTCDCRQQLCKCMEKIAERGEGMVIHIPRQDGRGMGLPFKLATLRLQAELKVDTVAASYLLDPDGSRDVRTYAGVIAIFKYLEIPTTTNINLETNNPKKLEVFAENNYIVKADPLVIPATEDTLIHLRAKQEELGHMNLIEDSKGEKE